MSRFALFRPTAGGSAWAPTFWPGDTAGYYPVCRKFGLAVRPSSRRTGSVIMCYGHTVLAASGGAGGTDGMVGGLA